MAARRLVGRGDPLIKIVKASPRDRFELRRAAGGWNLLVAGAVQRTGAGQAYLLGDRAQKLLALYQRAYGAVIPSGAWLVLGNLPGGTLDSTRFGLVGSAEIAGKVVLPPQR